jgi:hypothetical protein
MLKDMSQGSHFLNSSSTAPSRSLESKKEALMTHKGNNTATPEEIADWMVQQLNSIGWLKQSRVAVLILTKFGDKYVYRNKNRNWAINKDILDAFRKKTPDNVVWSRSRQEWRKRRHGDPPGRMIK